MTNRAPALVAAFLLLANSSCSWLTRDKRVREAVKTAYSVEDPQFVRSAEALLGNPLVEGNAVVELINGDEIFAAMLEAIRGAKETITFENFIWSSGAVSDRFVAAVSERAKAGVEVLLIVDSVGSAKLKRKDAERMTESGAKLVRFNSPLSRRLLRLNQRTHRKILVVDGRVGFIGGVCLSDAWQGDAEPERWRDTHFRVEGPVVAQLQAVFAENWLQARSELLHGPGYFPALTRAGAMRAHAVKSGYHDDAETTRVSYLLSFAAARKKILIAHSYFVPDSLMIDALLAARRRGVEIEVITPLKSDNFIVGGAARPRWEKLLEAGVRFWEYEKTLYHCKIVVVDGVWSIVGSANFDERSMRLSDEANLNVLDRAFAEKLARTFEEDKRHSKPLTLEQFKKRKRFRGLMDHFYGLFRSQL